jgi:hypothetical protein
MVSNRMLAELGQVAARYNENAGRHALGCCVICRKAIVGMMMALLDPENWKPEDAQEALARMQAEMDGMKAAIGGNGRMPPPMPSTRVEEPDAPHEPEGLLPFPPPFRTEDE